MKVNKPNNHKLGAKLLSDGKWIPVDDKFAQKLIDGAFVSFKPGRDGQPTDFSLREGFIEFMDKFKKEV